MELKGKNAIVTGGASGIGKAVINALLEKGANAVVLDIDDGAMSALRKELPKAMCIKCDITDYSQVEKAIAKSFENGNIDILVNNAGIVLDSPLISVAGGFKRHDVKAWDKVISTNLTAVFYVTSHVAERMAKSRTKGVIVNVSSIAAAGNPGQTAYSAAKAGVKAMTRLWADELAPFGIRVAAIAPGFTETNITAKMADSAREGWRKRIPLKRFAKPEEIAGGVVFMIENDYFNGATLPLDGGLRM